MRNDDGPSKVSWKATVRGVLTSGNEPTSAELDTFERCGGGRLGRRARHIEVVVLERELPAVVVDPAPNSRHRSSERSPETSVSDARGSHNRSDPSTLAVSSSPASLKKESETSEVWPPVSPVIRCPSAVSKA